MNAPLDVGAGLLECLEGLEGVRLQDSSSVKLLVLLTKINACFSSATSLSSAQRLLSLVTNHQSFNFLLEKLMCMATQATSQSIVAISCLQSLVFSREALEALVKSSLSANLLGLLKASTSSSCSLEQAIVLSSFRLLIALVKADIQSASHSNGMRLIKKHAGALQALVSYYLNGNENKSFVEPAFELLDVMVVTREGARAILATKFESETENKRLQMAIKLARVVVSRTSS